MSKTRSGMAAGSNVSGTVIETVADAVGTDPVELTPPLYDVVDPGALERIFSDGSTMGKVMFTYNGCEVSVFPDGFVSVEKLDE